MPKSENAKLGARIVCGVLILAVFFGLPAPNHRAALAQSLGGAKGETPYGGLRIFNLICTCSANALIYVMDYATNIPLALIYQPGASILYSYYDIYGTYLLGSYSQGSQCSIYVGKSCAQIQSQGMLGSQPGTGTSL